MKSAHAAAVTCCPNQVVGCVGATQCKHFQSMVHLYLWMDGLLLHVPAESYWPEQAAIQGLQAGHRTW